MTTSNDMLIELLNKQTKRDTQRGFFRLVGLVLILAGASIFFGFGGALLAAGISLFVIGLAP